MTVEDLLADLARIRVVLYTDNNKLIYHSEYTLSDDTLKRLRKHKAEILEIMANPWPAVEAEPAPCGNCNGWEFWENPLGRWRCMKCDPPTRAERWLEKAERLRNRYDN